MPDAIAAFIVRVAGGDLRPGFAKALALDERHSSGKRRVGIHVAGIEKPGIGCGFKRSSRPFAVATVPLRHLGKNARFYSVDPPAPQLLIPPVCAGFGIRGREQVARLAGHVDGVIVGSALVEVLERGEDPVAFLRALRAQG